jgi:hypothetical protein
MFRHGPLTNHSVMITARKYSNLVGENLIDDPVLVVDASRPTAGQFVLQGFRFADPLKWILLDFLDKPDDP